MADPNESPDADGDRGSVVARAQKCLERSRAHTAAWRRQAREDFDFYAGEQWDPEDLQKLQEQMRPAITFNRVSPLIDVVSGSEINNRQETRFLPREVGDARVNEILTGAAKWVRDLCDAEDEESEAFRDQLIAGMGCTETRLDYETDLDGEIKIDRVDPIEMYWDPDARKQNLADARWVGRMKRVSRDAFMEKWPGKIGYVSAGMTPEEQKAPHVADEAWQYKEDGNETIDSDAIPVFEYQWYIGEPVHRVMNPTSGEIEDLDDRQFRKIRRVIDQMGLPHVKQTKRRYYQAFIAGKAVLEMGSLPSQTGFTYKFITGKRDRNNAVWFGLMRQMKDPQRWANKWLSQILHILNSNSKGGIIAEQDAFADPRDAEEKWARPDAIVWAKPGGIAKIQPKPQTAVPAGFDRLTQFAVSSMPDVTGISPEMLGLVDREQAGVLEYQRRQSALTILAPMFNALRRYRKEQGRLLLEYIQKYLSDGRLIRIVGDNGAEQYIALTKQPETATYDVVVDQAPSSPNQREQVFAVLQNLLPVLLKMGVPMPPELLDYMPIPASLAQKWKEMLQQPQGGPEQQDPRMAAEAQATQVKAQATQAQAQMQMQSAQVDAQVKMADAQRKDQQAQMEAQIEARRLMQEQQIAEAKTAREVLAAQAMAAQESRAQEQHAMQMAEGGERLRKASAEADRAEGPDMVTAIAKGREALRPKPPKGNGKGK